MTLLGELFGLALYLLQQAGVLLGVGAEMVLLISYLLHIQARGSGPARFVAPARFVERLGLGFIVLSGLGVVLYHVLRWDVAILVAPAFIAKWLLIGVVLVGYKVEQQAEARRYAWRSVVHGFIGGTWLALFLLHTLAPDTTIVALVLGYAAWMAFFAVIWGGFVTALSPNAMTTVFASMPARPKLATATQHSVPVATPPVVASASVPITLPKIALPTITLPKISLPSITLPTISMPTLPKVPLPTVSLPKHVPAAPAPEAPHAPLPTVYHIELEAPHVVLPAPAPRHVSPAPAPHKPIVVAAVAPKPPVAPAPAPSPNDSGLPKIWVMPRGPGQV